MLRWSSRGLLIPMCRIFGFRSVIQSQVHRSLVSADNALVQQSDRHPDGWGVAYYNAGAPHVIKSVATAMDDHLFQRVSGIVASETVLAHLRTATQGSLSIINTHPFPPVLRRFILGDSDSEVLFYLLLGHMARRCELSQAGFPLSDVIESVRETIEEVVELTGAPCFDEDGAPTETYLTFALTNGRTMVAHQGGKPLRWTTHKRRCPDREHCPSFGGACEAASESGGFVKHLVVSSEPLQGDNVWATLDPFEMVGVDWSMKLQRDAA